MKFRILLALCLGALAAPAVVQGHEVDKADRVLVDKSDRQIYLMRHGEVWKSYPVGLGFAPEGHKQRQGDGRTPEGDYVLDWRNPKSKFYLSMHVSYPDAGDKARAAKGGVNPGGDIFVHGYQGYKGRTRDWTWGCIAVSNAAMDEIWATVPNGTPITIRP